MRVHFYEGHAFTSLTTLPGQEEAPGNPAIICFSDQILTESTMQEIAKMTLSPMTTFLSPCADDNAEYDVRYFSPNGTRVDLCGHATIVATSTILERDNVESIRYKLDPVFYPDTKIIKGIVTEGQPSIIFPLQSSKPISDVPSFLLDALYLKEVDVEGFYISNLNDHIVVLKDVDILRTMKPDFGRLIDLCETSMPHRTIVATASSKQDGLDYEARVFAPAIGVNEDIACGSANCSVANIWQRIVGKSDLQMVYPSIPTSAFNKAGGYQRLLIRSDEIVISSGVRKAWDISGNVDTEQDLLDMVQSDIAPRSEKLAPLIAEPIRNGLISSKPNMGL